MTADDLRELAAERRRVGWELSDAMTPDEMDAIADQLRCLRDLLCRADNVIAWETTPLGRGFQEEIEAALK